jgi:putative tryptophan/tyrosine transport system substrate-binding protein
MNRRDVLLGFGVAAAAGAARAQESKPVIGFLHSGSAEQNARRVAAYLGGLGETGFVPGKNVTIEFRWADGHNERLPQFAAELIRLPANVIATLGSAQAAVTVKAATSTIPIVFAVASDPVALGLVASLNRPGGNATGSTSLGADLSAKRLQLMHEMVPQIRQYFALVNPTSVLAEPFIKEIKAGAAALGLNVEILRVSSATEIEAAFAGLPKQSGTALFFTSDALFYSLRTQIVVLAARYAVPAIFDTRDYVDAGGLACYGANFEELLRLAGNYTGRILKGEKPANLAVAQSAKFEFVLNLKTAKALGIAVPASLASNADDVIE